MSSAKRKGIIFAANQLGKSTFIFDKLAGDVSTPESIRLNFENNLTRIKGSVVYSDYDVNSKDPMNQTDTLLTTFDSTETPNYALQGGSISVNKKVYTFSNTGSWHPERYSPPSPEGWNIYDYNAFSNYIPPYNSSGLANTNYIIYNTLYEPNSGIDRTQYDYPVRWNGEDYSRVPLFNFASWVSVANIGNTDISNIRLVVPKYKFDGAININPKTNAPKDLLIYSHRYLVSTGITYPITLSGTMGVEGDSEILEPLAFEVYESDANSDFTSRNRDYYTFNIDIPNTYSMDINDWMHMVFYWGSHDSYIDELKLNYTEPIITPFELTADQENLNYYIWSRNSFFNKRSGSGISFSKTGLNDNNIYLYNQNNSQKTLIEQRISDYNQPFRYKINESISTTGNGISNSTSGLKNFDGEYFLPLIIAAKNSGCFYDEPEINLQYFTGELIPISYSPDDWKDFTDYPIVPDEYNVIAKLICSFNYDKLNMPIFKSSSELIDDDNSVIYIEMVANNVFKEPVGDTNLSNYFSSAFETLSQVSRNKIYLNYFQTAAKNILSRFSRMNLNKFITYGIFDSNIYDLKSFHNLLKFPSDSLVKVDDTVEPKAVQFDENTLNLINRFATISTSKNFAGFNSTSLYLDKIKLDHNVNFEVYLERSYDEFYNHLNDDTHGLTRDYSFKIKFSNTNNELVIKNLFLNASKYVLSNYEYDKRLSDNLSVDGYFKLGQYDSIPDYKLYSDSALIPDLKRETYRKITNKENSPSNPDRLTEQQFEEILTIENSNITKDEIISRKASFGLTDSFYEIDTSKPSEVYNGISELGMTVSNYSLSSDRHWIDNTNFLYGESKTDNILNSAHLKDLRNDSFIISGSGYTTSDNTINLLENISDQQILASTASTVNQTTLLGSQRINNKKMGIKIICDETQEIKSIKLKLKSSSPYINLNSKIRCDIYSDKSGLPDELLAIGSDILLKNLNYKFDDFYFYINYKLFKNKTYWLVLSTSQLPPLYEPNIKGSVNVNGTGISGIYNPNTNTFTNFEILNTGVEFGFGTTVGSQITNWYAISSIASSTFMTVANTGSTSDKLDYALRYFYGLGIKESNTSGAVKNLATYASTGWTGYEGTAFIEFYKPDVEVYGSFNKNYENSNLILPKPNTYRETENYKVDEYWSINCKEFDEPQLLYIYPRSVKLNKIEILGSGTNGSNIVSIASTNFNEKIMSGLAISQTSYFGAGTLISSIFYDRVNDVYKLTLSSNNLQTFTNQTVGIGTSGNIYVKRANDVYVYLNYYVEGGLATTQITLEKSPTWITHWYSKSPKKYNHLQKDIKSDEITASYNLNFENKSVIGATSYINGYSVGIFNPLSSVGYTVDFKFVSSGGLKLFINDSTTPSIDKWTVSAATGYTHTHYLSELSEDTKLEVQFNHTKTNSSTGQTLIGYWKRQEDADWKYIDDSFYIDNSINSLLIDSRKIQSISLMNIVKTEDDLEKPNYGSPLNDLIVLRSV